MTDPIEITEATNYSPKSDGMRKGVAIPVLRVFMAVAVLSTIPFAYIHGEHLSTVWVLSSYVMPALVVMFAWGVLLDMLMIVVFRAGRQPEDKRPYSYALLFDAALLSALVYSWGPFYLQLLS